MATRTLERPARAITPQPTSPELQGPPTGTANGNRNRAPVAFASIYAPCPGRSLWWLAYVCPWCGHGHLGRARDEADITGKRKARCGRLVTVLAARTYRGR